MSFKDFIEQKRYRKKYRKLHNSYKRFYKRIAKNIAPWDYQMLLDFIVLNLKEMREFYSSDLVMCKDDNRLEVVVKALAKYGVYEIAEKNFNLEDPFAADKALTEFFTYLGENITTLWD